jgi:hypothetical protein
MKDIDDLWQNELMCGLVAAQINYQHDLVILFLPDTHCTDMRGAIKFCKRLLKSVKRIDVRAGKRDDYGYAIFNGDWRVTRPVDSDEEGNEQ